MHIEHAHSLYEIVFAKVQNYEFWPALVATCLKNGCYKVSFIGVEEQAIVMPADVKRFTPESLEEVKRCKEFERNRKLREAICAAIVMAERRIKEDNVIDLTERRRLVRGRGRGRGRGRNRLAFIRRIRQMADEAQQEPIERDIETELKESLDKLARYSANFLNPVSPVQYSSKDAETLMELLLETEHRIQQSLQKWVVEKLIMAITETQQWSIHPFEYLLPLLKLRFETLKRIVLSQRLSKYKLTAVRRQNLIERVNSFAINLGT